MYTAVASVEKVSGLLVQLIDRAKINKRELFQDHIEPLFTDMKAIHQDYMTTFRELYKITSEGGRPTQELVDHLKDRQVQIRYLHDLVRSVADALAQEQERRLALTRGQQEVSQWVEIFARSVREYFDSGFPMEEWSWYSDFLSSFEGAVREPRMSPYSQEEWRGQVLQVSKKAFEKRLPEKWQAVAAAYARLRALCL